MPFTFSGTYTQNDGDEPAAGTVDLTAADGTNDTATLDENGAYELELDAGDGTVTVVETFDGVPARTFKTGATDGATIDTSRDLGRVGFSAQSGASVPDTDEASGGDVLTVVVHGPAKVAEWAEPSDTDLSAYVAEQIHLSATDDSEGAGVKFEVTGIGNLTMDSDVGVLFQSDPDVDIQFNATGAGAINFGVPGQLIQITGTPPEVPATPSAQDVVDALVAIGWITQAAP